MNSENPKPDLSDRLFLPMFRPHVGSQNMGNRVGIGVASFHCAPCPVPIVLMSSFNSRTFGLFPMVFSGCLLSTARTVVSCCVKILDPSGCSWTSKNHIRFCRITKQLKIKKP